MWLLQNLCETLPWPSVSLHLLMFHMLFLTWPGEVKSSVILDHEMTPNYRLVAQASDGGGRWCRAEVQLAVTDVNDHPPIFTLSQYTASVYEDTATKALLTRIQAIDPDAGDTITTTSITATIASVTAPKKTASNVTILCFIC